MAGHFTVDANTNEMRRNAEDLRTEAQAYHRESQQLIQDAEVLAASWEGEAKEAFVYLLRTDTPEFLTLYQELDEFCNAAIESANVYDRTQSTIASEMRATSRR